MTAEITASETILCRLRYRTIKANVNLDSLNSLFTKLPGVSILGGNTAKENADGFSYWASQPVETFEFTLGQDQPFEKLDRILNKYKLDINSDTDLPDGIFKGGWIGYFGYELGRYIEKIPETTVDDIALPLMRLSFYDRFICYDLKEDSYYLVALELPDDKCEVEEKLVEIETLLSSAKYNTVNVLNPCCLDSIDTNDLQCNMTRDYYLKTIEKIKKYIYDGIVYQVNFSQRFACDYTAEPFELFHWQNQYNPSGYSAYIAGDDFTIVSASPEMFAIVNNGWISTKPIKGTQRRLPETSDENIEINKQNFKKLAESLKEQAELNMIIDLERNDLVRICEYGTRSVTQPRTIEAYPTVFHAVATVSGKLRNNVTMCDILKGIFPGGSITGAPKISSMEIIDETEPTCRGVYTGSIGYIGFDGSVCLNIAL